MSDFEIPKRIPAEPIEERPPVDALDFMNSGASILLWLVESYGFYAIRPGSYASRLRALNELAYRAEAWKMLLRTRGEYSEYDAISGRMTCRPYRVGWFDTA